MANSVDPDQTAPMGAVCSGSTLFASRLNLPVMLGNYLQQTTSADYVVHFQMHFFLGALMVNIKLFFYVTLGSYTMCIFMISTRMYMFFWIPYFFICYLYRNLFQEGAEVFID